MPGQVVVVTEHITGSELVESPTALYPSTSLYPSEELIPGGGLLYPSETTLPSATLYPLGAALLEVTDVSEFDQDGGQIQIGTETHYYEVLEDGTQEDGSGFLQLNDSLTGSYRAGEPVYEYPQVVERWADVLEPNGEEVLRVRIPHALYALLPMGIREVDAGEQVSLAEDGTDHVITDVLGKAARYRLDLDATDGDDDVVNWYHPDGHRVARIQALYNVADPADNTVRITVNPDATPLGADLILTEQGVEIGIPDGLGGTVTRTLLTSPTGTEVSGFLLDNAWQSWTPTLTGWSANPTNSVYRYMQTGKLVVVSIRQATAGTSNATTKSISAPVLAATPDANALWGETCFATDNGTDLATASGASIAAGTQTINFSKDLSATTGGWTAAGNHKIRSCTLIYEAA